ncbi:MAG: hypothetical protein LQ341_006960 [Variospora aurantia]|nr:MAG: hypothetical protein LQ341_006960 [Variospora aurantia]
MSFNETVTELYESGFNQTLLNNTDLCTLETCPLVLASVDYVPSLGGNLFYLTFFAILLLLQLAFGYQYRTWSFTGSMFGGLVLEIIGYVARVQMHYNPFESDPFLMYVVIHTFPFPGGPVEKIQRSAPCFITAAIYLSLSRIILVYGESLARFKPRTYTVIFICCDVFSLVLQAIGGALADTADTESAQQTGIDIMIAGLSFQVVSLTVFMALCADYAWAVSRKGGGLKSSVRSLRTRLPGFPVGRFHLFVGGDSPPNPARV